MWAPPAYQVLQDGRAHFSHGPIDLVIAIEGGARAVAAHRAEAVDRAWHRFSGVLNELVAELPALREPVHVGRLFSSPVARRMQDAVEPFGDQVFVTPMAAVAGAVADEIRDVISVGGTFDKVHVNNGGDIALHLDGRQTMRVGLVPDQVVLGGMVKVQGTVDIRPCDGIGGVATSGRHGRSFSLGIADAVTVLASGAAEADVAATLIANAVDTESAQISRVSACQLDPDSDLGDRLVTVEVGKLATGEISHALDAGEARARDFIRLGLVRAAALHLGGVTRIVGAPNEKLIQQEDYAWT